MNVEIVCVGTELLLGQIVNSNGADIGSCLADAGLDHYRQTVVGDNLDRVAAAVSAALDRADGVIITGGIGPTQDDITREALCAATGRSMDFDDAYAASLAERWQSRGREMPASNLRQAEHPEGALLLPNPKGTAPGLLLEHGAKVIFALPGVPAEMLPMLDRHVIPELVARGGGPAVVRNRIVRTWGESESRVAEMLDDIFHESANPTLAFLASAGEIKVRITARAETAEGAEALIAPVEEEIRRRLGKLVFGTDEDTVEQVLIGRLSRLGWTLGTVESATGGRVAARITSLAGSSVTYRGSLVTYATDLKARLAEVDPSLLAEHGPVSEQTTVALASGGRHRLDVDVCIAVTGSAGPEPQQQQPGTMIVAVETPRRTRVRTLRLPGDRERVLAYAATAALHLCRLALPGAG